VLDLLQPDLSTSIGGVPSVVFNRRLVVNQRLDLGLCLSTTFIGESGIYDYGCGEPGQSLGLDSFANWMNQIGLGLELQHGSLG
jgi:hypothetical protein